jgi:hypothetical protein
VAGSYPVPGYTHLATARPQGGPAQLGLGAIDVQNVSARLLATLNAVGARLGKTVTIFSGYRTDAYSQQVGGFAGDPHSRGIAVDATIDGQPIGNFPGAVALIHSFGARSGATDFSYQGKPDPSHVDLVGSTGASGAFPPGRSGAVSEGAAATGSSINSPDTFWYAVETKLGLPHTRPVHDFLQGWANVEGTKARFNPLATTLTQPGATNFNSVGVKNYPTPDAGVQATADTLKQYPHLLAALKSPSYMAFDTPAVRMDLNRWQSGKQGNGAVTPYTRSIMLQYQGNPSGKSASDWFSNAGSGVTDAIGGAVGDVLAVPKFLAKLADVHNILRGLQVLAGAVLVLVGVVLLARQVGLAADVPAPSALPVPVPVP